MHPLNIVHQFVTAILRKFQSVCGFVTIGARAIIINEENKILLVKHTYQPHWYLPGGGVKKNESTKAAVIRELREEVGVIVKEEPQLFGIYLNTFQKINDYPIIYIIKQFSIESVHSLEIEKMTWFAYQELPPMISPGTKRRLDEYFNQTAKIETW